MVEQGLKEMRFTTWLGELMTEPAQGRGWDWRPPQVPSSLNCSVILYLPSVSAGGFEHCLFYSVTIYIIVTKHFQNSTRSQTFSYPITEL